MYNCRLGGLLESQKSISIYCCILKKIETIKTNQRCFLHIATLKFSLLMDSNYIKSISKWFININKAISYSLIRKWYSYEYIVLIKP